MLALNLDSFGLFGCNFNQRQRRPEARERENFEVREYRRVPSLKCRLSLPQKHLRMRISTDSQFTSNFS